MKQSSRATTEEDQRDTRCLSNSPLLIPLFLVLNDRTIYTQSSPRFTRSPGRSRHAGGSVHQRSLLNNDLTVSTFGLSSAIRNFSYLLSTATSSATDTPINPGEIQWKIHWTLESSRPIFILNQIPLLFRI